MRIGVLLSTVMRLFSLVCGVALLVSAAAAHGDEPPPPDARALYEKGQTEFALGNFLDAAHQFEAAYRAAPQRQLLLYNIGQAYRAQYDLDHDPANLRRARAVYRSFADLTHDETARADARRQEQAVDAELRNAEQQAASARALKTPATFETTPPPVSQPTPPPVARTPPAVDKTPPPVDRTPSLVEVHTPELPPPAEPILARPPVEERTPVYRRWWLWTAVGVVLAGAAIATVVALGAPGGAAQPSSVGGNYMPAF